jgi:NAD-reducing hydrogenase small subunit
VDKITIHRASLTDIKRITERCAIGFIEGGVAMRNMVALKDCLAEAYVNSPTAVAGADPWCRCTATCPC